MADSKRQPEARFQAGGVSASVFLNESKRSDGTTFLTRRTIVQRTYVDGGGQYQSTSSLDVNDLPRAIFVLMQAYAHCTGMPRGGAGVANEDSES
jgi:hypothetical protein